MRATVLTPSPHCLTCKCLTKPTTRRAGRVHAQGGDGPNRAQSPISEDLIARLKAAEEEAQRLKRELADARAEATSAGVAMAEPEEAAGPTRRIDSGDLRRETLSFVESKERNWLNEADMAFFTGGGPSEAESGAAASQEEAAVVRRRLLGGLALTAAAAAFAIVPTERLQPAPSKPLFFYLVPLVRTQALLEEVERVVPEGDYEQLRSALARIQGAPNNVQDNLRSAAAALPDARQAQAADALARDVYEYVRGIDYQTYYDSVGGATGSRGGAAKKELFDYSLQSTAAAKLKLKEFLALMPREQLEAAQQQAAALPF